ncbi:DnaJ domain-containing protein [Corticibacterium sp. UT-5YL-CI-8]|nr:DnaJ domain-containing protein [Tianweitania sp. UT-5YL-CI-8]
MTVVLALLAAVIALLALVYFFLRLDAAQLARLLPSAGPIALGAIGAILLLTGRAAIGGGMLTLAVGWYTSQGRKRAAARTPGRRSTVRTAALEMELDHDSGGLDGFVLAGHQEGRSLAELSEQDLIKLYSELFSDQDSRQLLETYLDGRFPLWREHAKPDDRNRQGIPPSSGAMTKEEAYKILGLETGAATADIRKAHRRLMQRLHPDLGGSSFLASRINEAKDILLSDHD